MHELSIVMNIIDIATREAEKANAGRIEEIELEIGELSTVEMGAFDFAWKQAVKNTKLENASRVIHRLEGRGRCLICAAEFPIEQLYDPCPHCGRNQIEVLHGKELRVKSLVVNQ
jgi:hydrogenase nickel incorporation protein HypA/HybF